MSKVLTYLNKLITRNTGVSSLSFILVALCIMSVLVIAVICACMIVEIVTMHTITSSLDGYASMIGAIAGLVTAVGLPKAINNYGEHKYKNKEEKQDE